MKKLYSFKTSKGTFYIVAINGGFQPMYNETLLGHYTTPQIAVENLAHGHTWSVPGIDDASKLGISDDLSDWELLR